MDVPPKIDHFAPSILINGRTYYPTNLEWLLGFALAGCKWAQEALPEAVKNYRKSEIQKILDSRAQKEADGSGI